MTYAEFYEQMRLKVETKNSNGSPVNWLMQNWYELTKDDLAHIAIEALIAGETACERENWHLHPSSDEAISKFYDDLMESLEFYLLEEDEDE